MKYFIKFVPIIALLVGCKKLTLDKVAFPSTKLEAYQFENYDAGEGAVPIEYAIQSDKYTLINMVSTDKSSGEQYTIYGVYIGDISTIKDDTVIMYCHGQSLHMDAYWPRASLLANLIEKYNYGIFMMDYRGYGMSDGESSEQGLYEDVDASINWLIDHGAQAEQTFYYGFSLGCIPVIDRAVFRSDFKPSKIILESPLASVANLTQSSLLLDIDPDYMTTLEFNNAEKIKAWGSDLLWIHGKEDDYIAIENGELIYSNHNGTYKEAIRVPKANHSDIPAVLGYENYLNKLEKFILRE